jgi:hypothetical protein
MATASTSKQNHNTVYPDLEAAGERVRQANERFVEVGRKMTSACLDGVERYVTGLTAFERKLGGQTTLEPVAGVFTAHAKMTEDLTTASVSAARELIA